MLAHELGQMPNQISIEGHTDSRPFPGGSGYSNWELSSDRGNAARRIMQQSGIRNDQVSQVRGFADQRPRKPNLPEDSSNRRISLIVQYTQSADDDTSEKPKAGGAATAISGEKSSEAKPADHH